jgi:hypothetical protein
LTDYSHRGRPRGRSEGFAAETFVMPEPAPEPAYVRDMVFLGLSRIVALYAP